jgi:predicted RNA-binding protein
VRRSRRYAPCMEEGGGKVWVLTGSLDNFRATAERNFTVIGMKERRRRLAEQMAKGDLIIFYVTGVQAFAGSVRVAGDMYESRAKIWPGKPSMPDPYPWRFDIEPVLILDEDHFVPAEELAPRLEHVRKWPPEHWHLAFQGQLRPVSYDDAAVLERALRDAAHYQAA